MGQALYRKYRSKKLSEIVGQEHITQTLDKALQAGRISHAYLFTGPRGVGKTSIARILAHEINGLPYSDDQSHIDIIEIDAASNNGVEDVRDLREKVYVAPAIAKYKVYIIDEVHMLSKAAFNALLKTLEEPPAHVVFILATTESHKLPETIISRTQRFIFRPIDRQKAVAHLRDIAKQEGITITDEALELVAEHGDGSFRDSISLLDQAAAQGTKVDAELVRSMLGVPPEQAITELLNLVQSNAQPQAIVTALAKLYDQGYQAAAIAKRLSAAIRQSLLEGTAQHTTASSTTLAALLEVPVSHDPERYLEIVLLANNLPVAVQTTVAATPVTKPAPSTVESSTPAIVPQPVAVQKAETKSTKHEKSAKPTTPKLADEPASTAAQEPPTIAPAEATEQPGVPFDDNAWQEALNALKKQYNTLYSIARMASPRLLPDGHLELGFAFAFHSKRLSEPKNRKIVSDAVFAVTKQPLEIVCLVDPTLKPGSVKPSSSGDSSGTAEPLAAISNIFGGGELLES